MTGPLWYSLVGVGVFVVGFHAFILRTHLLRKILAANVMSSGVFLLLVATALRNPAGEPDPVPHALVLTGIVVTFSATALALALAAHLKAATGRSELDHDRGG